MNWTTAIQHQLFLSKTFPQGDPWPSRQLWRVGLYLKQSSMQLQAPFWQLKPPPTTLRMFLATNFSKNLRDIFWNSACCRRKTRFAYCIMRPTAFDAIRFWRVEEEASCPNQIKTFVLFWGINWCKGFWQRQILLSKHLRFSSENVIITVVIIHSHHKETGKRVNTGGSLSPRSIPSLLWCGVLVVRLFMRGFTPPKLKYVLETFGDFLTKCRKGEVKEHFPPMHFFSSES